MPDYRRFRVPGGSAFFTVNLLQRRGNALLTERIDLLRDAVRRVRRERPFTHHRRLGGAPGPSPRRVDAAARRRR